MMLHKFASYSMPRDAIIFDGDDTLWQTQVLYNTAKLDFYDLMAAEGFGRDDVSARLAIIDKENADRLGFSRKRFPTSLKQVYLQFCDEYDRVPDTDLLNKVKQVGCSVFQRRAEQCCAADQRR